MDGHNGIEALLCRAASRVLKRDESEVEAQKSLVEQGGDMLSGVFFAGQCREFGLLVDVAHASSMSLRDIARQLVEINPELLQLSTKADPKSVAVPNTQLQSLYRTFGSAQGFILDVEAPISLHDANRMLERLVRIHVILGASLESEQEIAYVLSDTTPSLSTTLVPYESDEKAIAQVKNLEEEAARTRPSPHALSVLLFGQESRIRKLGLVAHSAAVDAHSWHVLLRDIQAYTIQSHDLSAPSYTFSDWVERANQGTRKKAESVIGTEPSLPSGSPPPSPPLSLPKDQSLPQTGVASSHTFSLSLELTEALDSEACHRALRTEIHDLIFASLSSSFGGQLPSPARHVEIRDGRPYEENDAWAGVIGCFDELVDIVYHCTGEEEDMVYTCRNAKDSRRCSSSSSTHHDHFHDSNIIFDSTRLRRQQDVTINKAIQSTDQVPGRRAAEVLAHSIGGLYLAPFWIDARLSFLVVCGITSGAEMDLKRHSEKFVSHLQDLVATLTSCPRPLPTLSDFPYVSYDYPSLDHLFEHQLLRITPNPVADICNIYPCTAIQDNMLMGNSLDKGAYICSFTARATMSGAVASFDAAKWAMAWNKVVEKHSSLRTVFVESKSRLGHFDQIVLRKVAPPVDIITSGVLEPVQVEFQPFEVPHHLGIIQEGPGRCLIVLTMSHAITDGHSAEVILNDLSASAMGRLGAVEKSFSYAEYALSESRLGKAHSVSELYWQEYLSRTQATLLPVTREKAGLHDFQSIHSIMPVKLVSMDRLCRRHKINLASVCQVAWGVVLRSYLGVNDVCFSYISSLRNKPIKGIMTAIGPLITTLLCSTNLDGDMNILDAIRGIESDYADSLSHEAELSSTTSVRRWSNTVMSFRRKLVQADGQLHGFGYKLIKGTSPTNVSADPPSIQRPTANSGQYDVSLVVSAGQSDMEITLDYWASRMDREYAQQLLDSFQEAIHSIFRDIGTSVSRLELISQAQKQRILKRNSRVPEALNRCVHELINERIQEQPSAVAIDAWDGSLTYKELEECYSHLTQHLLNIGVKPEVPVGICMDKSKIAPVAMLAILQAGGAVVPIGVQEPIARVRSILADSSPVAVITDEKQGSRLSGLGIPILNIVDIMADESPIIPSSAATTAAAAATTTTTPTTTTTTTTTSTSTNTQESRPEPENTAWIFYTSGSTGKPKGVLVQHQALATSMIAHGVALNLSPGDRVLQFAAHTFDVSLSELFTTLIYGGCVCIPNETDRFNDLVGSVLRLQTNVLSLTSSMASTIRPEDVPGVRKLILFGEEVKASVLEAWLGKADIFNAYGPTESSIFASVSKPLESVADRSNIGFPMNVNFWVTDPQNPGRLCGPGVPGELLIEGPLLARGYLNDEAKTSTAFVRDPAFASLLGLYPGRRFYRTGDIVRQEGDSSMSYIGRRDTQLKIHGQRLDVTEVEHWIIELLDVVIRAVVDLVPAVRNDSTLHAGGVVLFAAVEFSKRSAAHAPSGTGDILPASDELREEINLLRNALQEKLPSYMIPTFFIPFGRIPLTASAKTDRGMVRRLIGELNTTALQEYMYVCEDSSDNDQLLLTETGQMLKALWAAVLNVSSSSIRASDHFLYRGGDSLLAIKLVDMARREHIHITVKDVLEFPRLQDLARVLDERNAAGKALVDPAQDGKESDPPPFSLWQPSWGDTGSDLADIATQCGLSTGDVEDVYPCTSLQQSMLAATEQRPTAYRVRLVFAIADSIDITRFREMWNVMAQRNPVMRTHILLGHRSGPLQVLSKKAPTWQAHEDLDKYVAEDQARPMGVGQPLVRFALVHQQAKGVSYFVWTAHHSVYDGWSSQLIYRQLAALYLGDKLPPSVPFTRFIAYLQRRKEFDRIKTASYWREQLGGDTPSAFPAMSAAFYQPKPTALLRSEIDTSVYDPSRSELSLADVLRAAWAMTLVQYLGTSDVVFGAILSGRNAPVTEITELIAPTITTVPVRVQVDRASTVAAYLAKIRSQAIEMIPFEHTGLQEIKQLGPDLGPVTDIKHALVIEPPYARDGEGATEFPGLQLVRTDVNAFDTFALTIQCQLPSQQGGPVKLETRYDSHIVSEAQVAVLLGQLGHWVSQFLDETNHQRQLRSLEEITSTDLAQIKKQNARIPVRDLTCLHHLIRDVAQEQPDSPAVCAWDGNFTYKELWAHARRLAQHLSSLGIRPESSVVVCMDKSRWTVVTILAILEAGGVVVMLRSTYPLEQAKALMEDCRAAILLTNAGHTDRLAGARPGIHLVEVDEALLASLPDPSVDGPICANLTPDHAAWIVYTSGSTGLPKGCLLVHGGLATSLPAHGRATRWHKGSRTLQFASHEFDVTLQEIMTTLIMKGCVCIPSEDQRINSLPQAIRDMNVNQMVLTPTVASMINPDDVPCIAQIQVAGELIKPGVVERWIDHAEVVNIYGPSECSVYSSCGRPMQRLEDAPVIGYPLDNCNFWITSTTDHNRLCPIGIPGELLVENSWQARCYLNNPELTAQCFVVDPGFVKQLGLDGDGAGRRMYRTGDIIQQNPNGSYTYIGRMGNEVKFRGHRVDLGRIEYWIGKLLAGVQTIVVDLVDLQAGKKANDLVAVVDFSEDCELLDDLDPTATEEIHGVTILAPCSRIQKALCSLRDGLADKLPSHMVPTAFMPWKKIPLTSSGKTDRGAVRQLLTNLEPGSSLLQRYLASEGVKTSPQTKIGKQLQQLWADVLSIDADSIGTRDHFTRLGGDSLAAMKLVASARQVGLRLTVASIFTHPVLEECSRILEAEQEAGLVVEAAEQNDPAPFELMPETPGGPAGFESRLADFASQCRVAPHQITDVYPCTPMQEALFAITARQPTAYTYRQVFRAREQKLDTARFQAAWEAVARTLPILRTRIVLDRNSGFLQAVVDEPLVWHMGGDLDSYLAADKVASFEPGKPLLRCAIVEEPRSGAKCFVLTTHHSMFDKWSMERILSRYLYPALSGSELPKAVPYPRFIRHVLDIDVDAASRYWTQTLAGVDEDSFTDFPSLPSSLGFYEPKPTSVLKQTVRIGGPAVARLQTPFPSLLRAAWALTVAQYAGVQDVAFAVNLSGRSAPIAEITELVAPTLTTVPVRINVHGRQRVQDFLDCVHRQGIDMIPFEHVGLQRIKRLVPNFNPADLRHLFLVHTAADAALDEAALRMSVFEEVHMKMEALDNYPLAVLCRLDERQGAAEVSARFDQAVIPDVQLQSVLRQFEHNVSQLAVHATSETQAVGDLALINPYDLQKVDDWNLTGEWPSLGCVHDLVIKTVRTSPDAPAVSARDGELTYQQLDQAARCLAQLLLAEGCVGTEVAVGLCMDKSRWAMVAILAILYAGGAVVPLGVQLPPQRIRFILQDASPAMVLCDEDKVDRFPASLGAKLVTVNEATLACLSKSYDDGDPAVPSRSVRPENMAWITYTSGSTGVPKGVTLEHRGLYNVVLSKGANQSTGPTTRVFQFAAFTFDVSISDILMAWTCGGTVCLPSEEERMNDLVGSLQRLRANSAALTPSTAALIPPAEVPELKVLALGGEASSPGLVQKWLLDSNVTLLINGYGPAECSVTSTQNLGLTDASEACVIGRPLRGTQAWVVDPHNCHRLVPIGAVGELLLEGPQVARGYRNDPVKTSAAFITDPGFTADVGPRGSGRRMYRSGDLVRYDADGKLTILGRSDSQIKIRGQRVDLGEIESSILKLMPKVRMAVVEYLPIGDHQRALVAALEFLAPDDDDGDSDNDKSDMARQSAWLRDALARTLPAYMVPRVYLPMDTVPKNASGKVDRKAVRHFMVGEGIQLADTQSQNAARRGKVETDTEAVLRTLWAAVLGVEAETIDRHDDFFGLGGDSISAMKLVATARTTGALAIRVLDIFENPVLLNMAVVAKSLTTPSAMEAALPPPYRPFQLLEGVDKNGIDAFLDEVICPVTGTGKASIQDVFPAPDAVAFNAVGALTAAQAEVNTFVLDTDPSLHLGRLQQSCMLLAQHVEAFRTTFAFDLGRNRRLLQVILKSYEHNVPVVKAEGSLERATERFVEETMCRQPLRLGTPMVQMAILWQEGSKATRILLRMSHAIYDGMSLPIIMDTLRKLYDQGDAYAEPPLSSFAAYVADLYRQTSDTSYSYWRSVLEGSTMPALVPETGSGQLTHMRMAVTKVKAIPLPTPKGEGITTSAIISCAWAHVLARFTGTSDVVFGDTISGRNVVDPSISGTVVGCCATNVPMRIRFANGSGAKHSALQLLKQVRDQQRSRIPHEGVGPRSMIRQCTDWSPATRFTSIVNHRPARPAARSASGQIGFQVSTITTERNPLTTWYDLAVLSRENDGTVEMSLGYSTMAFHPDTGQALLDDLVHTVRILVEALPSTLDQTIIHGTPAMPRSASDAAMLRSVTTPPTQQQTNPSQREGRPSNAMSTNKADDTIPHVLDTIWFATFPSERTSAGTMPSEKPPTPEDMRYLPFYRLGGDLLDAAHFIASIQRRIKSAEAHVNGDAVSHAPQQTQVTIDDIIQHPSLVEFASALHQQRLVLV
ncbi:Nonribosomal peptide synthetase-like protein [Emericellopsis cladophorae]|uniref:Nonribosomal peptide synthetase-like protein n=1 Tax=Emericellopsis cladophorae TaxID=2686198 RepID=A0A9P9XVJ5_9HYPO|nr:Nonribosomal peptide synthetase-like protein [Emericellopsis cladophorae]KAI6778617.1 Nonribosomal peptide synthetase-like protein [Emericellopsis cladophorae]